MVDESRSPEVCFLRCAELWLINGRSADAPTLGPGAQRLIPHFPTKVQEAGRSEEPASFPGAGEGARQQAGALINREGPAGRSRSLAQREALPYPPAPSITPRGQGQAAGQRAHVLIG